MNFLTDENVSPKIVRALREAGHDVFDIKEAGLQGVADNIIIKRARRLKRIIVSEDLDFGNLQRYPLSKHPGTILMHFQNMQPQLLSKHLLSFLKTTNQNSLTKAIVVLEEGGLKTLIL